MTELARAATEGILPGVPRDGADWVGSTRNGTLMEKRQTAAEREELRAAFLKQAAEQWDRLFDPARQGDLRTFDQREAQAEELAHTLVGLHF